MCMLAIRVELGRPEHSCLITVHSEKDERPTTVVGTRPHVVPLRQKALLLSFKRSAVIAKGPLGHKGKTK